MAYDIIGDIHGQADKLEALLPTLGYRDTAGAWRHRQSTGDLRRRLYRPRFPAQVRSVHIVRRMVNTGVARAVMGNHELNAIAWHNQTHGARVSICVHATVRNVRRAESNTRRSWLKSRTHPPVSTTVRKVDRERRRWTRG